MMTNVATGSYILLEEEIFGASEVKSIWVHLEN